MHCRKKASTSQYGYRKCGTHPRVLHSPTGTARANPYKETEEKFEKRGVSMERSKADTKEKEVLTAYLIKIQ